MPTIQPRDTFRALLQVRNEDLYYKWFNNTYIVPYGETKQEYTNSEKDELAMCARIARRYTNFQGE
ncbi:hypothetical protein PV_027 (endogenous virus) [Gutovirus Vc1]|uniref:Uncharacterized protein n=1 Tax=Vibrio phage Vc1 TaxID=1480731 RepID=X2KT36_9CAUD|nr:hypothetical protein HOQ97_gp27 [Vibrio phage Vc1]AHN84678.1 hypothetical protein PV_027 [Vibrio phage Vc1]